jgi:eukaryotic-like serine/threonine-protein kinase
MRQGDVIGGKYRLIRLLGDGGMGAVYEANHEVLGARVAIKVLHDDLAQKREIVDRFLREARVLAQMKNAHLVRVLDIAMAEGATPAFIVMDLLTGEPLGAVLGRERRLPLATAVDYASQILEGLAAAHAQGVIHRDLKPENVFVTKEGDRTVLKIIDFGIAKAGELGGGTANLTVMGAMMGTPEYMAPEQAHSAEKADARSDIFAVGVMLYEMISGARPVEGEDPRVVALAVERGDVQPLIRRVPDVPRDLAGLVHRAMAARPELRFASADEMRMALSSVLWKRTGSMPAIAPPSVATPDPVRGTGTMLGDAPLALAAPSSGPPTDPGVPSFVNARSGQTAPIESRRLGPQGSPQAPPMWSAPPPGQAQAPLTPQARGRGRGSGGAVWLLLGMALVLGGGVALAFAFTSGAHPPPRRTAPSSSAVATAEPIPPPSTPTPEPSLDPSLGPLPTPTPVAQQRAITNAPHPSPSSSAAASSSAHHASPPPGDTPFGVPPFTLPSSFPNPFPSPGGSATVFTLPTSFPPFGMPTDPPPPASAAPAPSAATHHPGR